MAKSASERPPRTRSVLRDPLGDFKAIAIATAGNLHAISALASPFLQHLHPLFDGRGDGGISLLDQLGDNFEPFLIGLTKLARWSETSREKKARGQCDEFFHVLVLLGHHWPTQKDTWQLLCHGALPTRALLRAYKS